MELKEIQALMRDFEDSDTRELEIADGDFHLYLSKNKRAKNSSVTSNNPTPVAKSASTPQAAKQTEKPVQTITAPLVGTVYLQPKPDAEPYIQIGDQIQPGQVVCVIEAMKMMTEIKSDVAGVVTKINVENEELVEVEQPLFTLTKEESND